MRKYYLDYRSELVLSEIRATKETEECYGPYELPEEMVQQWRAARDIQHEMKKKIEDFCSEATR